MEGLKGGVGEELLEVEAERDWERESCCCSFSNRR